MNPTNVLELALRASRGVERLIRRRPTVERFETWRRT